MTAPGSTCANAQILVRGPICFDSTIAAGCLKYPSTSRVGSPSATSWELSVSCLSIQLFFSLELVLPDDDVSWPPLGIFKRAPHVFSDQPQPKRIKATEKQNISLMIASASR